MASSGNTKKSNRKKLETMYSPVMNKSNHGMFSIEDEDDDSDDNNNNNGSNDDDIEIILNDNIERSDGGDNDNNEVCCDSFYNSRSILVGFWNMLTFQWMKGLLVIGNERALEQSDLYKLSYPDTAQGTFAAFKYHWTHQIEKAKESLGKSNINEYTPSLAIAYLNAFGYPFLVAGLLKLIHDSSIFVGPLVLNKLINFLNDPDEPISQGLLLVLVLFLSQLTMSICLRQYFFWCYRVGMRLRSAVVTSVYAKSLVISNSSLSKRNTGEITNLMSVDSTRLQDLTPYLHAIWYSAFQIIVALYFLWQQMGPSCLAGISVIILTIPLTGWVSKYLKTLQTEMSSIRDERVKNCNEVLAGIKIIKFQSWEGEYKKKINAIRDKEMAVFKKYVIMQSLSGALFTAIPLLVSILTFTAYIASGHVLDVATALTSLALFDILRFPLFMLPNMLNNCVEAKVSLDRVQSYLLEEEKENISSLPLKDNGILLSKATLVWNAKNKDKKSTNKSSEIPSFWNRCYERFLICKDFLSGRTHSLLSHKVDGFDDENNALNNNFGSTCKTPEETYYETLFRAQINASEKKISELELQLKPKIASSNEDFISTSSSIDDLTNIDKKNSIDVIKYKEQQQLQNLEAREDEVIEEKERILTLSRINLTASPGELVCIVGQVGSGKSSILSALLGDMRKCYGKIAVKGKIAFMGQRPFIQNCTLRDNILFGLPYNEEKYQRILEECALIPDLKMLPAGELTEIGERGINLSGGQKARVALARTVYADADVYLLDDPLAAVDAHVGQHLFEKCILNLKAKNKCIILTTNAIQFLPAASNIVVLKEGRIVEQGSYKYLIKSGLAFADLIASQKETCSDSADIVAEGTRLLNETNLLAKSDVTPIIPITRAIFDSISEKQHHGKHPLASSKHEGDVTNEPDEKQVNITKKGDLEMVDLKKKTIPEVGKIISVEEREVGDVSMKVYGKWFAAAGGTSVGILIVVYNYLGEAISILASWWLSYWSEHREDGTPWFYLGIYVLINVFVSIFLLFREWFVRMKAWTAAKVLFRDLLSAVIYAPMSFFDTTPLGRITNRFSKDTYTIDEQIPQTVRWYMASMAKVTGVLLYISVITPLFIIALFPICFAYVAAQRYYIKTSRELTRLDSTSRSPIYALFGETLDGLTTIKAFKSENRFCNNSNSLLDSNQQAYFLKFSANCWLAVRLEFAGTCIITFAALFAVLARDHYTKNSSLGSSTASMISSRESFAGMAGLAISLALSVTQSLNWSVRMASDLESQMVSVERVTGYANMQQEANHYTNRDPPPSWPTAGAIEIENISMRYRPGLPLVINDVSLSIKSKQKIGIVGRTGSGKSSLVNALLRLIELDSGRIVIDGIDVAAIGLHALRSNMSIIPQDPVLFSGMLANTINSLDDIVNENGTNYSVGQRQLLCIGRALISGCKIIIMDEATAAVDIETDSAIQKTLREEFSDATCLTVAHRINTIIDCDKVLVMDDGKVAEFDHPSKLLADHTSMFAALYHNWEKSNDSNSRSNSISE